MWGGGGGGGSEPRTGNIYIYIFIPMFNSTCGIHVIIILYSKKIEYYCHQSLRTSSLEPLLDLLESFKNNCNKNGRKLLSS